MPRLFAAIEVPQEIRDMLARLRQPMPGTRWIEPADFHATLRFFGDITPPVAREIADGLSNLDQAVFEAKLSEPGTFGGNEPRSIWAGLDGGEALLRLQSDVERIARQAGLPPARHPFRPHITLARLQYPRIELVARWLSRHGGLSSPAFTVTRVALMSSRPHVGGGPYGIEDAFDLVGAHWNEDDDLMNGRLA